MRNRKLLADDVREKYIKGLPDGLDEQFIRTLPILFDRIKELEVALAPFAKASAVNRGVNRELVEVYLKDCNLANDLLNTNQSFKLPPKEYYYPAE